MKNKVIKLNESNASRHPLVLTPGDNDWTDCRRESNGAWDPLERLAKLREVFFRNAWSLGRVRMPLSRQDACAEREGVTCRCPGLPENVLWTKNDVVFSTIHVVGSNDNRGFDRANDAEQACRAAADRATLAGVAARTGRAAPRGLREDGANPSRGRRCERMTLRGVPLGHGPGKARRERRESEDRPACRHLENGTKSRSRALEPARAGGGALASTGLGMVSNYLAAKSAAEAARAQMAQQDRQALISSILNQFNSQREIAQRQGEFGAAGSTTIPSRQGWRERQAMLAGILPGLRNANVQMPSFLQSFKPQLSGGLRLPEGGLGQDVLSQFSPNARQSAEADLDRNLMIASQGNYTAPHYANYYGPGYDSSTQALNQFGGTLRSQNQAQIDAQNAWLRDLLNRAIAVNG